MRFDLDEIRREGERLQLAFSLDEEALAALPKAKRDSAYKRLKELEEVKRASPLHFYNPLKNPKQYVFHSFRGDKAFLGGTQSGKTTGGVCDCLIQAQDEDSLPERLRPFKKFRPPFRCRIGGQGREEMEDFIFEKIRDWVTPSQLAGGEWAKAYDGQNHVLHFANGSYFQLKTYDQDTTKWGGSSLDRVYLDEEPPSDKLVESRARVMARNGDIVFAMTPVSGMTHMFNEFDHLIAMADKNNGWADDGEMGLVLVDMDDNWALSHKAKEKMLKGLSESERIARKEGRFVALHGLIYQDFDLQPGGRHVIETPEDDPELGAPRLPENVNVIVGIDTGWAENAGCAVVWAYLTPKDEMVVFEEFLVSSSTIKQVCDRIKEINSVYRIEPIYYVIDPVARNKQSQTGRSDQMVFADHGIVCIAGQNAVGAGIVMVRERLQFDTLKVWENCTTLINEFRRYRWKSPPRTGEDGKPRPYKKDDHEVDALRYLVASRPYLPDEPEYDELSPTERMLANHRDRVAEPPAPIA